MEYIYFLIGFLIIAIIYSCTPKMETTQTINKNIEQPINISEKKNPYTGLRNISMNMTAEKIGASFTKNTNEVYGIIMEQHLEDGIVTFVSFKNNEVSILFSNGAYILGGGEYKNVREPLKMYFELGQEYLNKSTNTSTTPLPEKNMMVFYLLTNKGKFEIKEAISTFENTKSNWFPLFKQANDIITEIMLVSEKENIAFPQKMNKEIPTIDQELIKSILSNNTDNAIKLIESGANPNAIYNESIPIICLASSKQQLEIVNKLIEYRADVNAKAYSTEEEIFNLRALNFSSANGNIEISKALINAGANVNAQDDTGLSPLMASSYMGHSNIVKLLLANGVSIELKDNEGYTALIFASNSGKYDVAKILLKNRANVNNHDKMSSTPLMFAAQHGFNDVVLLLLKNGADKNAVGKHGLSAIEFAKQSSLNKTIEILKKN